MKRIFLLCLTTLISMTTWAYTAEIDGIFYNFSGSEAIVTYYKNSAENGDYYYGEMEIPETVDYNGTTYTVAQTTSYAFNYANITKIKLPETLHTIGTRTFNNCALLTELTIPDSYTSSLAGYLCVGCSSLETMTIGNGVPSISSYFANGCTALKVLTIGSSVGSIDTRAFYDCPLTEVTSLNPIPPTISSSSSYVFYNKTEDCVLYVPAGAKGDYEVATGWSDFTNIVEIAEDRSEVYEVDGIWYKMVSYEDQVCEVTWGGESSTSGTPGYTGSITISTSQVRLPNSRTEGNEGGNRVYNVMGIGENAFNNCQDLESVTVSLTASTNGYDKYIGAYAFRNSGVKSVSFARAERIDNYAFDGSALESFTIGDYVTTLGKYVFNRCENLKSVSIGSKLTSITDYAFSGASGLTSITIPSTLESIGSYAFENCTKLATVNLGTGLKTIGDYAFTGTGITELTIPSNVTSIGSYAFQNTESLGTVSLDCGTVGESAFSHAGVKNLSMSENVKTIGVKAFEYCSGIESLTILGTVSISNYAFQYCTGLKKLVLEEGITTTGYYAFQDCTSLSDVTLPETFTTMDQGMFAYDTALEEISLPSKVSDIKNNALRNTGLKKIYSYNTTPPTIGSDMVFYNVDKENCVVYVPVGTVEDYKAATYWSDFYNIVEMSDTPELAPFTCDIDPADGETVPELSKITFSNDEGIFFNEDFDSDEAPVIVYDSEGKEVAYIDNVDYTEDANGLEIAQIVNLDEAVVEAGDYTVTVAAKLFYIVVEGGESYNDAMTLSYTVEPDDVIQGLPNGYLVDPENESYQEILSSFTLSLESGASLTQGSNFSTIVVVDHWGQEVTTITLDDSSETGKVICTLDEEISAEGTYFITFPKGTLYDWSDDGGANPAFMLTYYVTGVPGEYSYDPADGSTLQSLKEFTVYYSNGIDPSWNYSGEITVTDESGSAVAHDADCEPNYPDDWDEPTPSCTVILDTEIVSAGKYTITIPEGYFIVGSNYDYSEEIVISYTINGTETGINGISISLDDENVEGIYSTSGQKLTTTVKGVNIIRYNDGSVKKLYVK